MDGHKAVHSNTITTIDVSPYLGELAEIVGNVNVCKLRKYAVEPFMRHPTSMSYIYKVIEHLHMSWVGIWLHTHTFTTTGISLITRESGKTLGDVSVQTMQLWDYWGCRTFQNASHIEVFILYSVWAPWPVVDGHMAAQLHCYHHRCFPTFGRVGWNRKWCECANHATSEWLRL